MNTNYIQKNEIGIISQTLHQISNNNTFIKYYISLFANHDKLSIRHCRRVELKIYSILGQEIRTLVNEHQIKGQHIVKWNGKNDFGKKVASGLYFYRLRAGSSETVLKMILVN